MVTANRLALARRAVQCFARQTWPARELVIVDDGDENYAPMLDEFPGLPVRYERVPRRDAVRLGGLRNLTLELAAGDHCMQWDDDEWYHPQRIETQMAALEAAGGGACVIRDTLMHMDDPAFVDHLYRTGLRAGTPGTILHERTTVRYPNVSRGEDSDFRDALKRTRPVHVLQDGLSHLVVRCFHGKNTWHRQHFFERLHYTVGGKLQYAAAKYLRGNLLTHPAFRLNAAERQSAAAFLDDSRSLGLISASTRQALA
jgi:glycosyltransferase involved in cell wall biosynthesis